MKEVMCDEENNVVWKESQEARRESLNEYIKIFTDEVRTTLKSPGLVLYSVYAVLLTISSLFRTLRIWN